MKYTGLENEYPQIQFEANELRCYRSMESPSNYEVEVHGVQSEV